MQYKFDDQEQVRNFFVKLTGLFKNLNYARLGSSEYSELENKIENLAEASKACKSD